jgi:hypothetical protein
MEVFSFFPTGGFDNQIDTEEKSNDFIKEIRITINRVRYENTASLYYERENYDEFIEFVNDNAACENYGTLEPAAILDLVLRDAAAQKIETKDNENCLYRLWNFGMVTDDFPNTLKYFVDNNIKNDKQKCLFLNFFHAFDFRGTIPIFKDCQNDENLPRFVHILQTNQFKDTDEWLNENQKTRQYNVSDNRHIEIHGDYREGKSPIIGGQKGKEILDELLSEALGHNDRKILFAYDEQTERYIRYEDENSNEQFHGYHLAIPRTHERDTEAEKLIPEDVKEIIEYRKEIKEL